MKKILFILTFSLSVFAQTNPEWIIYNTSNSALPTNSINEIVIDNLNRKWVSFYDNGVLKIDDSGWNLFTTSNSNIPTNYFNTINVDNEFNFWGGTGSLLTKFDGTNWFLFGIPDSTPPGHSISSIVFDGLNNVWFLKNFNAPISSPHYLIEFSEDSIWTTHTTVNTANGHRQLLMDNNQTFWIGDGEGLYFYSGDSLQYIQPQFGPLGLYATDIKMDSSGNLWMALGYGGWGNLVKYDGNVYTGYSPYATAIEVDREGNVWVGTWSFPDEVKLLKFDGTNWTSYNPTNSQLPNTIMINDLAFDTLGNLWIATEDSGLVVFNENGITPVELISFTANVEMNNVNLSWLTASETNNMGFEIERSETSKGKRQAWEKIGFVDGKGTTTDQQFYSFIDKNVNSGKYQYRLKQIDFDGTYIYSNIVEAEINLPLELSLSQNYPNPFNPTTKIQFTIPSNVKSEMANVILKVFDILGNEVSTLVNEEKPAGSYEINFDASGLASGIYYYKLRAGNYSQIKKMILLK